MMKNPHSHIVIGEQVDILKSKIVDLERKLKVAEKALREVTTELCSYGYQYESRDKVNMILRESLNKIRGE
jgi:hypothetical protein